MAAAATLASTGTYVGARNLLSGQADQARQVIPKSWDVPPRADGVYVAGGGPVQRWNRDVPFDLHLMIFGDSTATGYGSTCPDSPFEVAPTIAFVLNRTRRPDAAVIMIGANDITKPNGTGPSARRVGRAVQRLRAAGAVVVVGTCPDFGVIKAIPQPLRWVTRSQGLRLARAQASAVRAAGGVPVPFSDLLAPEFYKAPELLFSPDMFHPSGAGYQLAAKQLLPALCNALGDLVSDVPAEAALESRTDESGTLRARIGNVSRLWRRTTGVPAPIVVPAS